LKEIWIKLMLLTHAQFKLDLLLEPTVDASEPQVSSENLLKIVTSPEVVFKILSSLNTGKATGPDGVGNKVLRSCAQSLSILLTVIINRSLKVGQFLYGRIGKVSNITPIYQKRS